jgi:sigma-E factor negative regulatory protein RseA
MTSTNNSEPHELISALVDGNVSPNELTTALESLNHSELARERWDAYHLIGDTMRRQGDAISLSSSLGFSARFRDRLAQVKTKDAALMQHLPPVQIVSSVRPPGSAVQDSANDSVFKWKMVSGLASVMAVAMMGWHWMGGSSTAVNGPQWASATMNSQAPMIRDPRLDRLLAAHQQHSGFSDSQMTNGFLRHATYSVSEP